jgi:LysR family glycine cleavage system transcriptional activator/LysR family transcriptional regulator of beta-lactamase
MAALTLLDDSDGSPAWADWHREAGLKYRARADTLTVPDPNVRVQAVIDGQGVALNDALVQAELDSDRLVRLSTHQMDDYGYFLVHEPGALSNPDVAAFADWILSVSAPG